MFVIILNLTPDEYREEKLEEIKHAIRLAIVNRIPEMEPVSGEIAFSCPWNPSVTDKSKDDSVMITVEGIKDNLDIKGNLAKEIYELFKKASPKADRKVMVRVKNPHADESEYEG